MDIDKNKISTIDEYISSFPKEIKDKLEQMRKLILSENPNLEQKISYQMPTFKLNKNLVHFAAFKNHIGFYPTPSGVEHFKEELSKYNFSKGAIQFTIDEPLPVELIKKIVRFRIEEDSIKPIDKM